MTALVSILLLACVTVLWLLARRARRAAARIAEEPETEIETIDTRNIVVPACGECGAIVWENRSHGNTFCEEGHKDPEVVLKPIEDFD